MKMECKLECFEMEERITFRFKALMSIFGIAAKSNKSIILSVS
jgi:hypothetical protein